MADHGSTEWSGKAESLVTPAGALPVLPDAYGWAVEATVVLAAEDVEKGPTEWEGHVEALVTPAGALPVLPDAYGWAVETTVLQTTADVDKGPTFPVSYDLFILSILLANRATKYKNYGYYIAGSTWLMWLSTGAPNPVNPDGFPVIDAYHIELTDKVD